MAFLILAVKSKIDWINEAGETPFFGGIFVFLLMFIPAVLLSFLAQAVIPGMHDDLGFTKAMLILLPVWNLFLWVKQIKLYLFLFPSWIILGGIAIIKGILLLTGNDA
jgi:hypothetical protein